MNTQLSNRYQVLQLLGTGGFGQTFLAEDTHMPSRRVCVIKQLKPITTTSEIYQIIQERFQREAVILENLGKGSSQIPELYAYFSEDNKFYLVQEWIDGNNLTGQVASEGCFGEERVRDLLISILPVLSFIHGKGIIHRDIKPDNIILRSLDGQPVLIDFGAVKEIINTEVDSLGNPTSSIIIGTPGFMPSEQAIGRVNFSSDLYSLGLTAIYLLTAKLPHELDTDIQTGEIIWHNRSANISPSLTAIIDRSICLHARDRYATAQEMLTALQQDLVTAKGLNPVVSLHSQATQLTPIVSTPSVLPTIILGSPPPISDNSYPLSSVPNRLPKLFWIGLVGGAIAFVAIVGTILLQKSTSSVTSEPKAQVPASSSPITSPSPTKSASPQESKVTPSVPPSSSVVTSDSLPPPTIPAKELPAQALRLYFNHINNREFPLAWQRITPRFQKSRNNGSYATFLSRWQSIETVEIYQVKTISRSDTNAIVNVQLTYVRKKGQINSEELRKFDLVWDATKNMWLIDNSQTES